MSRMGRMGRMSTAEPEVFEGVLALRSNGNEAGDIL